MASKRKRPLLDGDAIAKTIANDLPGWKVTRKRSVAEDVASDVVSNAVSGPGIQDLRRKFLGSVADSSTVTDNAEPDDYGTLNVNRTTVQVEPEDGGPSKVADIVGGKAKIVQG